MRQHTSSWLVLIALGVLATPANARQCNYGFMVLDLGDGTCQGCNARAAALNEAGQVVGRARVGDLFMAHAFIWDPVNGIQDIGVDGFPSSACCINEAGQVAGSAATPSYAFFLDPVNGMIDLGTLGGSTATPLAMNDAGQVVGYSDTGSADHAFIWDAKNGMQDLGSLVCCQHSRAVGINSTGQVIGASYNAPGDFNQHNTQPFVWDSTNGLQPLSTLGGSAGGVNAINDVGQIAGWVKNPLFGTPYVPCLYSANNPTGQPFLPNGFLSTECGEAVFVHDDGVVFGWLEQPGFGCVFSYGVRDPYTWPGGPIRYDSPFGMSPVEMTANGQGLLQAEPNAFRIAYIAASLGTTPVPLEDLIPPQPSWINLAPGHINNHGEIVGHLYDSTLATIPYIVWPCPPDVNKDGAVNVLDLIELLLAFGPCDSPPQRCPADTNKDGVVDVDDLFEVLANFGGPGV